MANVDPSPLLVLPLRQHHALVAPLSELIAEDRMEFLERLSIMSFVRAWHMRLTLPPHSMMEIRDFERMIRNRTRRLYELIDFSCRSL
jgi:hypothetical protein